MKNIIFSLFVLSLTANSHLQASRGDLFSAPQEAQARIIVNNRILAKVNGKLISTHDVMKKMDMLFFKQFPQYISMPQMRMQFYQINWKAVLDELINKELILADAEENKIEISNGDVRQELEAQFGPNTVCNLNKIGMSFEEAFDIVKGELTLRRMIAQRVHNKALRLATPNKFRQAYEEFISNPENARPTIWRYQVLTVRDRNPTKGSTICDAAFRMLIEESIPFDQIPNQLKERQLIGRKSKVSLSEEFSNNEKDLSDQHKQVLLEMDSGMYSQPVQVPSRDKNGIPGYRIFYVKEKLPGGFPTYKEMEPLLKEKVLENIIDNETNAYIDRLRHHFHVRESDLRALLPDDYKPFILRQ